MPLLRGRAPTSRPTLVPSNAFEASSKTSIPSRSSKALSLSSSAVPSAAFTASGISSSRSRTGTPSPSRSPAAMRKSSA